MWLYIGHGGLLKREGTVEETGPSSICYRLEVYDAAVYVRGTGELGVHARSNWERGLYRQLLGRHLFDNEQFCEGSAKYTLEPLRLYGRQAIQWIDVPGIEWVRLVQLST